MEQGANDANQEVKQLRTQVSQQIQWLRTNLGV